MSFTRFMWLWQLHYQFYKKHFGWRYAIIMGCRVAFMDAKRMGLLEMMKAINKSVVIIQPLPEDYDNVFLEGE